LLICTKTRGAWLAAMAVAVIWIWYKFFWQKGRFLKLRYILAFGCALIVAAYFPLKALDAGSPTLRWIWWKNTAVMIKDHPLLGVGLGNFKIIYPHYVSAAKDLNFSKNKDWSFSEINQLTRVHNDHLQMLAELGLLGFLPYAAMFFLFACMFRKIFKQGDDKTRLIALCAGLSVLAFCIVATTNFPFERALPPVYLFMCFAVISFLYKKQPAACVLPGNTALRRCKAVIATPHDIEIKNQTLHQCMRTGLCILLMVFIIFSF